MEVRWEQNDYPYSLVLLFLPKDLSISGLLSRDYKMKIKLNNLMHALLCAMSLNMMNLIGQFGVSFYIMGQAT